jgi:hypothetical protein
MKTNILLLLQTILLFAVSVILMDGLIRLPDIGIVNIIIRAMWTIIVLINFSHALYLYLKE